MDIDPLASNPLTPKLPNSTGVARARRWDSRRTPAPQLAQTDDKLKSPKARAAPVVTSRPLVPPSEKRSGRQDGDFAKKLAVDEKSSITPDGGSAGREGRQFTVGHVGSNGQIFLRPTVRPPNQRYPQPPFSFPITPPGTAGLDSLAHGQHKAEDSSELQGSQWTPTPGGDPSPSPGMVHKSTYFNMRKQKHTSRHRRAMSDSTIQEPTPVQEGEAGAFKVVISKPPLESKSKTTEDLDPDNGPLLQISIPSWKLGTPRFTLRGTPLLRGSSYAPSEDVRSSTASFRGPLRNRNSLRVQPYNPQTSSFLSPHTQLPSPGLLSPVSLPSPQILPLRATYMSAQPPIEPAMFEALTFKPACDDRSIVRYSSLTNSVTAATPPRLVAEITSPTFLDYELISDFFLTFRSFLETSDLLRMLIARLRWALARDDEIGMIVKVRTFVAIRHWVLNYFVDDFVVDYYLRLTFCNLLNDFVDELSVDERDRKVPLKILGELKKCWRRVCAQYWDGPEFEPSLSPEKPIVPGGIAGHRDPHLDPSFWEKDLEEAPQLYEVRLPERDSRPDISFYADVSRAGHIDSILLGGVRPSTPEERPTQLDRQQTSPTSVASLDVASCSFPTKGLRMGEPNASLALGAHPVDPSSIYTTADRIASTPRALTGKRIRPQHRRNNSLTDSLKEHESPTEKVLYKNAEFLLTLPYAGSLVRGNLFPPGQALVHLNSPSAMSRQTTVFQPQGILSKGKLSASAMSGQGMKRLIGSVRKALSSRGQGVSPTQGSFIDIAPIGPRGATTNRLPGTAIVPQARRSRPNGAVQPLRVDLLGAKVADDFKKAVREDAADAKLEDESAKSTVAGVDYSAAHVDSSFELRPVSDAAITSGSKSIVIVDGTWPLEDPAAVWNPSVEAFADSVMPGSGTNNPTPPITPPGQPVRGNTPRRSSYILGQHVLDRSVSKDSLPPPIPGTGALGKDASADDTPDGAPPSINSARQASSKPPMSYLRHHRRQKSSRSYRSKGSQARHRWVSHQSGAARQSTVRSFDATTYSGSSVRSEIMPHPLRVLRRRPGGDLRGAQNIADLDTLPLHRSRSVVSLTTYSESLRSSYLISPDRDSSGFVDVVTSDYSRHRGEVFSLGALAEQSGKRPLSLFSTHSSKPAMRPSFELEAQKLAQIPDDMDDDGGVESALLKLEGKFDRKRVSKLSMEPLKIPARNLKNPSAGRESIISPEGGKEERRRHRHLRVVEDDTPGISPIEENEDHPTDTNARFHHSAVSSFLSDDSRETFNSIPLLERGLTDNGRSKTATREWTDCSILEGPDTPLEEPDQAIAKSSLHPSFEIVHKTESMEKATAGQNATTLSKDLSFLDVESDDGSDLSSELSAEVVEEEDYMSRQPTSSKRPPSKDSRSGSDTWEAGQSEAGHSPKLTLVEALRMSPETANVPELHEHQLWSLKPLPPTPDTTPTNAMYHQALELPHDPTGTQEALRDAPKYSEESHHQSSIHLPFILAFDSEILAQQFTLIEKDALNEVDWKELIEMRWKNANNDSRSWVDFLRNTDARGVEVVVARFNIMVKWAISEIVLTQDMEERARCIIKYLHIAAHCRRYRNFATMSQIAIALTSNEVTRLTRTWTLVPPSDAKTMSELESLVSPTRNFFNLRAEMEGVEGVTTDSGCIPFVGIYTHDLLFNAQRPSEIASSPTTPPLINFERCRQAAGVVKTLLRLLEASTYYQFQPIEGVTERCLWMGALSDEDIRRHAENLD
ncbi:ras GEF [Xylariaceae sp. FL0804]|nr:ras GEF [Xylariaceae sp. FL0804]